MSAGMRSQIEELDRIDETKFSPLSVLWLVNTIGHDSDADLSNKFIAAILSAEIPLYYINEDFDCDYAFEEYRLAEKTSAEIRMQLSCADYDMSDAFTGINWSHYFPSGVCDSTNLIGQTVPLWFGTVVPIQWTHGEVGRADEAVGIESLFVKVFDVKSACALQGIGRFCWPTEHPLLHPDSVVDYKLINGMWQRVRANKNKAGIASVSKSALLAEQRVACVIAALSKHHLGPIKSTEDICATKLPPVKQIYRLVSSEPSFSRHGDAGREPISYSSFNQLWKGKLRGQVHARLEEQR